MPPQPQYQQLQQPIPSRLHQPPRPEQTIAKEKELQANEDSDDYFQELVRISQNNRKKVDEQREMVYMRIQPFTIKEILCKED